MKLLFASMESAPFFKTGGLGDVVGALPKSLVQKGHTVAVVLPYIKTMPQIYQEQLVDVLSFEVAVGWRQQYCGIKQLELAGVTYYFIDNEYYFGARGGIYGYYDDGERFAYFQQAIIEMLEKISYIPDIIHCHDYHTAMIPFLLKEKYYWIAAYRNIRTVLTIHNLEFQGEYSEDVLPDLFGMSAERVYDGTIRFNNQVNFMKAGLLYADRLNTVSPSYAGEIQTPEFGCGLDVILRMEQGKMRGILNGIDYEVNNPETDPFIFANYSRKYKTKKVDNKVQLQKALGLPVRPEVCLVGIVSRLTNQKGFQLVLQEFHSMMKQDIQLVLLGTGDPAIEAAFGDVGSQYPDQVSINLTFDSRLAQKIYAASDIFIMPSKFEPCGLSQMIAMRYGSIPLVHEVGGLIDTVEPFNPITHDGTGFGFSQFDSQTLLNVFLEALHIYSDLPDVWQELMDRSMNWDFSWQTASEQYVAMYQSLM
jgi:starch synthase